MDETLTAEQTAELVKLYIAYFNRAPEFQGLQFHIDAVLADLEAGVDFETALNARADNFYEAAVGMEEQTGYSDDMTPAEFVAVMYENVLLRPGFGGEAPTQDEIDYWVDQLLSGEVGRGEIATSFLEAVEILKDQGTEEEQELAGQVGQVLENRVEVGVEFSKEENSGDLTGEEAYEAGKAALEGVDETDESVDEAIEEIEAGGEEEPGPGPGPDPEPEDEAGAQTNDATLAGRSVDGTYLWDGGGNSAENFATVTTTQSKIELGLKGYIGSVGDTENTGNVYDFTVGDKVRYVYSVVSQGDQTLQALLNDGYEFNLTLTADGNSQTFTMVADRNGEDSPPDDDAAQDSGYDWLLDGALEIADDEGDNTEDSGYATQNIQNPGWYFGDLVANTDSLEPGEYHVTLSVNDGGGSQIASNSIVLDVSASVLLDSSDHALASIAQDGSSGMMWNGTNNPAHHFAVLQFDDDGDAVADVEIALGGQDREGLTYTPGTNGAIEVPDGDVPVVKWSVANLESGGSVAALLEDYDIVLRVDTDPTEGTTNWIDYSAIATNPSSVLDSSTGIWWAFDDGTSYIHDDQGDGTDPAPVTQNIQTIDWLINGFDGNAVAPADGTYDLEMVVYDKGTTDIVGSTSIQFQVSNEVASG